MSTPRFPTPAVLPRPPQLIADIRAALRQVFVRVASFVGVPVVGAILWLIYRAGEPLDPWHFAQFASIAISPALVLGACRRDPRLADHVTVASIWVLMVLTAFQAGLNITTGMFVIVWAFASVIETRGTRLAVIGSAALMVLVWAGATYDLFGFDWVVQRPTLRWLLTGASVVAISFGMALMFRELLDRAERTVEGEAAAHHAVVAAQAAREEMLARAADAQRLESLGRLAGGVAHDVNNAIAIIALGIDELRREPPADERASILRDMQRATRGAESTTRQLLTFAKQGSQPGMRAVPSAAVTSLAQSLRRLFPESITVLVHAEPTPEVPLGVGELEQALLNVCLNARDAMPDGGVLTLRTHPVAAHGDAPALVRIDVSDTGHGMPEAVRRRALDPFFTTKGEGKGTGLGLAMVAGTIQQAGGELRIASREGDGTTVTIDLPAMGEPQALKPTTGEFPAAGGTTGRILVLEDEPHLQRLLQRSLARYGHTVTVAGTVADALMALDAMPDVDLLMTDAVLPDGGPGALVARFRERFPDRPVLVCSGYVPSPDLIAGIEAESYAYLGKPFDQAALEETVRGLLEGRAPARS